MYLKLNHPQVASTGKTIIGFNWIGGKELEGDLPSFDSKSPVDSRDTVGIFPECGERDIEKAWLLFLRNANRNPECCPSASESLKHSSRFQRIEQVRIEARASVIMEVVVALV